MGSKVIEYPIGVETGGAQNAFFFSKKTGLQKSAIGALRVFLSQKGLTEKVHKNRCPVRAGRIFCIFYFFGRARGVKCTFMHHLSSTHTQMCEKRVIFKTPKNRKKKHVFAFSITPKMDFNNF
jgi:hypothetical protein